MSQDFILTYAKLIVSHPESLSIITEPLDDQTDEITIYADSSDLGKLIGKGGKMVNAIKSVISGCKAKGGKGYKINIKAAHNG